MREYTGKLYKRVSLFTLSFILVVCGLSMALPFFLGQTAYADTPSVFIDTNKDGVINSGELTFSTIQAAITAATSGDSIYVLAGTYTEVGQIVIDKDLTITGSDSDTTIIKPAQNTGDAGSGNSRGWFLVKPGVTFNLSGVTLDGAGKLVAIAVLSYGSGTIEDNVIKNISYTPSSYYGRGIQLYDTNMTIRDNTLQNIGRIGIFAYGAGVTSAIIDGNSYTGKGSGEWLDYGVELGGGAVATISDNDISNNLGVAASVDGSTSAGILVTTYFAPGTTANITGNTISNSTDGIAVGYDEYDTSAVTVHDNDLSGNVGTGITSTGVATIDATNNWWGSADRATIQAKVLGSVDFSPYYIDGTMTTLSDSKAIAGFSIAGQVGETVIDESAHTILVTMPYGANVNNLAPTITLTGLSVSPESGVTNDFTDPQPYTVTSIDAESTESYLVTVKVLSTLEDYNIALAAVSQLNYTPASWSAYQDVVSANEVTAENTQLEVDTATDNIIAAQASLVLDTTSSIFSAISNSLAITGINNNLDTVNGLNWKSFSGLYFEKLVDGVKIGRITFTASLDLSNSTTQTFLQNLGNYMEANPGSMKFDASTVAQMKEAGAEIKMYGVDALGYVDGMPIIIKDDAGNILSEGDVNYPVLSAITYVADDGGTITFSTSHFTQFDLPSKTQTTPGADGGVSLTGETTEVILTNPDQAVDITIVDGTNTPTIDVSAFVTDGTGVLPEININSEVANVTIPDGATVTGPAGWDGIIDAPTAGTPEGGNAPAGFSVGGTVISIGSPDGTLIFDKAVSIVLPGVTGTVGYRLSGSTQWVVISKTCTGTYDNPTGAVYPGECFITNGTDTKILTFHFTSFGELLAVVVPEVPVSPVAPVVPAVTTTVNRETSLNNGTQLATDSGLSTTAILGSETTKDNTTDSLSNPATIVTTDSGWSIFGLMWYWWLLIVAVIASAWGIISVIRNRNSQDV